MSLEHMLRDEREALDFLLREEFEMQEPALPKASGIYKITCIMTNKIYIGSAINMCDRRWGHVSRLRGNTHENPYLQRAWNKYGEQVFAFEVLEYVLPISLTAREQYWLNKLKPFGRKGYNIARDAMSPTLGTKRSPETIEKMRQANLGRKHTPEHIEKVRQTSLGRKHTPEAIAKMRGKKTPEAIEKTRQAHLGRKRSPETREKMSLFQRGRKQPSEHIEKVRQANLGKKRTPEFCEEMRQLNLGNKNALGRKHTPESIEKMRQAQLNRRRKT